MKLLISIILISNFVYGQINSNTISEDAKIIGFLPLSSVDLSSSKIPNNFTTKSGWHIEHYGQYTNSYLNSDGKQSYRALNMMTYIYNDSVKYYLWSTKFINHDQIIYDTVKLFNETEKFLYFKTYNIIDTNEQIINVIPKRQYDEYYEFKHLIFVDYKNNLFVEYYPLWCQQTNKIKITNISNRTVLELDYKRSKSFGKYNTWIVKEIYLKEDILSIHSILKHKKKNKQRVDIREIKI